MKTIVILFHCLLAYNLAIADQTNTIPQVQYAGFIGRVHRHEIELSEVAKLPSSTEITNVMIGPKLCDRQLTEAEFRKRFDKAKPVKSNDDYIFKGDFIPQYAVAFDTKAGRFYADLNLGLSFLQFPDGRVVAISFNAKINE